MAGNHQRAEFMKLMRDAFGTDDPVATVSDNVLDGVLMTFLREAKNASSEQKMHWFLMRAGVREMASYISRQNRVAVKREAAPSAEEIAAREKVRAAQEKERNRLKRQNAAAQAAADAKVKDYAAINNLDLHEAEIQMAVTYARENNVSALDAQRALRLPMNSEAATRMNKEIFDNHVARKVKEKCAKILGSWVFEGGLTLGRCTADDLARFRAKEENTARGHLTNAGFYAALQERIGANGTVEDSVDPEDFMNLFTASFGAPEVADE